MSTPKEMMKELVFQILQDKEAIQAALFGRETEMDKSLLGGKTIASLADLARRVTSKHEFTIIIDDVTDISKNGVKALRHLRHHFHFIVAAQHITISKAAFLSNYQHIKLPNLSYAETSELLERATRPLRDRIEDYALLRQKVWNETQGNPGSALEIIERFRKEPFVSIELMHRIRHTAALKEIDMSVPFLILLSSLMVLRYLGAEMGTDSGAFRFFGGVFLCFALFARPLLRMGKRKYV